MDMVMDIQKRLSAYTMAVFGLLTGLAGLVLYLVPALRQGWPGMALLAAPVLAGGIHLFLVQGLLQRMKGLRPHEADGPSPSPVPPTPGPKKEEAAQREQAVPAPDPETIAVQLLGLLQREGRLLDFLQEDIGPYQDAQIGAAVREVHRGCREALKGALGLSPVLAAKEGSEVEVEEGFDPARIKLVGNVRGKPPFRGTLRHCGWRYTAIHLPRRTGVEKTDVLAPAEVEIV